MAPYYANRWRRRRHTELAPPLGDVLLLAVALVMLVVWGIVAGLVTVAHWLARPPVVWAWRRIPRARVVRRAVR